MLVHKPSEHCHPLLCAAFAGACTQGTAETTKCVGREICTQLALEVQLDTVPLVRAIDAPMAEVVTELLCPPEEVVLLQYRKEKAQILRVSGMDFVV